MSGKSHEEAYKSIVKLPVHDESWPSNLIRAPSLPPRMDKKDQFNQTTKSVDDQPGKSLLSNTKTASKSLLNRAPSMPMINHKTEENVQDEESEFSMGKLIRQASLSNSDSFPPRRHVTKGHVTPSSSSLSRHGSLMKGEIGKFEGMEKTARPHQRVMSQLKTQKSLNDLELRGFRDLGFDVDAQTSSPPPIAKKSTEDLKAQIKFWARAVASNVRHES